MAASPSIFGVVRCIRPWAVDQRALGLRYPTRVGSVAADVVITEHQDPEAEWAVGDHTARQDQIDASFSLPPDVLAAVASASVPPASLYPRAQWTTVDQAHRVPQMTVRHLILVASATEKELPQSRIGVGDSVEERLGDALRQGIEEWYRVAASWIEVHTAQDLDYENPRFDAWIEGGALATFAASGSRLNTGGRVVLTTHFEIPASPALLALAFERASTGVQPPLPHVLLRDARAAWHRRSYRRAVIDAAVAAEVALARWATARGIEIERPNLGKFIRELHERGTLSGKGKGLLEKDLVKPRNDAVHRGEATTSSEAFAALDVAAAILQRFGPLDAV